jgi:hypothetical protein
MSQGNKEVRFRNYRNYDQHGVRTHDSHFTIHVHHSDENNFSFSSSEMGVTLFV